MVGSEQILLNDLNVIDNSNIINGQNTDKERQWRTRHDQKMLEQEICGSDEKSDQNVFVPQIFLQIIFAFKL